jgi:hypothetical protein
MPSFIYDLNTQEVQPVSNVNFGSLMFKLSLSMIG